MKKFLVIALLFLTLSCQQSYLGYSKGDKVKIYWENPTTLAGKSHLDGVIKEIDGETILVQSIKSKKDYIVHKSKIISINSL